MSNVTPPVRTVLRRPARRPPRVDSLALAAALLLAGDRPHLPAQAAPPSGPIVVFFLPWILSKARTPKI